MEKLTRPWSLQIEFAEGCSRICSFCGITGIREKPGNYKFMTIETAKIIALQIKEFCPNSRIEYAMHGEPTMNPNYLEMIKIFRELLPEANMQLTTNGVRFMKRDMSEEMNKIFESGIDFVILDTYYPERDLLRNKAFEIKNDSSKKISVIDFYDDMVPNKISPWSNHHRKMKRTIILMDDLQARNGEIKSRTIYNHAGNSKSKKATREPLKKTCTIPFREISITWNGNINICCQDWKHEHIIENIHNITLKEIWNHPRWEAARTFLQNKNRSMTPCNKCDIDSGSRAGLLPKYPAISQKEIDIVGNNFVKETFEIKKQTQTELL